MMEGAGSRLLRSTAIPTEITGAILVLRDIPPPMSEEVGRFAAGFPDVRESDLGQAAKFGAATALTGALTPDDATPAKFSKEGT